jgi:histidine triad (HIT) family protein
MSRLEGCVFCAIASGRSPAEVLLEDELTLAFLDIRPAAPGHTLVIPRSHFQFVWEVDVETGAALMRTVVRMAGALRAALQPDGLTLLHNSGRAAGQEVPHAHWHLLPRWYGDGLHLARGPAVRPARPLAEVARQVRGVLNS